MNQLLPEEWREVKVRASHWTFQCDMLDKLPLEIVALIAEHMNLADIILLQRVGGILALYPNDLLLTCLLKVSRRWKQALSSTSVQLAAIRATMGDSALDPTHHPSEDSPEGAPGGPYVSLIKRRLRLERGIPMTTFQLPPPRSKPYTLADEGSVGYSNGICAWLEGEEEATFVILSHLCTNTKTRLTTENRESLVCLRISKSLVAAISWRGYCHVWDISTHIHKAFRIPSLHFDHFLIHGTKVALSYHDFVVHWSFDSDVARTVPVGPNIALLVLYPEQDQFTVACLCLSESDQHSDRESVGHEEATSLGSAVHAESYYLRISLYALGTNNEFEFTHSYDQEIPSHMRPLHELRWEEWHKQEIHCGQSSTFLCYWEYVDGERPSEAERPQRNGFYLTLIPASDQVAFHELPSCDVSLATNVVYVDQALLYAVTYDDQLMILRTKMMSGPSVPRVWYHHTINRQKMPRDCICIFGDDQFMVSFHPQYIQVWAF